MEHDGAPATLGEEDVFGVFSRAGWAMTYLWVRGVGVASILDYLVVFSRLRLRGCTRGVGDNLLTRNETGLRMWSRKGFGLLSRTSHHDDLLQQALQDVESLYSCSFIF